MFKKRKNPEKARKITRCDICGKQVDNSVGAIIKHKNQTGHRIYIETDRSMP